MARFTIANTHSGLVFGTYEADNATEALDVFARDAGYRDYKALQDVAPAEPGEIAVTAADE